MVVRLETLIESLKFSPTLWIFDNMRQFALVFIIHLETACTFVPVENFLYTRRAWSDLTILGIEITLSKLHVGVIVLVTGSQKLCLLLLLYLVGHYYYFTKIKRIINLY